MADTEKKTAKYRFLVDTIKEKIKNGEYEPGERMESENTLSDQFGYSRQTVRQALSVLEQEGLIERRRGSGTYISSESRRTPRGNSIAIVTTYISDYIFPTIIRGIEETLTNAGYDLTLNVTNNHVEEEARILQSLISRRVDGVIVEGTKTGATRAFPRGLSTTDASLATTMWFGTRRPSAAGFFAPTTATTCLSACAGVTALCATTTRLRMG